METAGKARAAPNRSHGPAPLRRAPAAVEPFPELACLRGRLTRTTLAAATLRAERLGTGADRALIAMGAVDEEAYVRALAAHLGLGFAELDDTPRGACALSDARLLEAARVGLAPLAEDGAAAWVIAPLHLAARGLIDLIGSGRARAGSVLLTTTDRLDAFALRGAHRRLSEGAANALRRRWPSLSAAPLRSRRHIIRGHAAIATSLAALGLAVAIAPLAVEASLALFFLAWLGLRFATALMPQTRALPPPVLSDGALPVYTVIAALYREARSLRALLRAIEQLDYPREKLDVLLAVEAGDRETRSAIAAYAGPLPVRVIVVPDGAPRTKPRALNAALAFARGHYTVIYDAEDRPEPDQLRRAVEAFAASDDRLACVQARLSIDNTEDGLLARGVLATHSLW